MTSQNLQGCEAFGQFLPSDPECQRCSSLHQCKIATEGINLATPVNDPSLFEEANAGLIAGQKAAGIPPDKMKTLPQLQQQTHQVEIPVQPPVIPPNFQVHAETEMTKIKEKGVKVAPGNTVNISQDIQTYLEAITSTLLDTYSEVTKIRKHYYETEAPVEIANNDNAKRQAKLTEIEVNTILDTNAELLAKVENVTTELTVYLSKMLELVENFKVVIQKWKSTTITSTAVPTTVPAQQGIVTKEPTPEPELSEVFSIDDYPLLPKYDKNVIPFSFKEMLQTLKLISNSGYRTATGGIVKGKEGIRIYGSTLGYNNNNVLFLIQSMAKDLYSVPEVRKNITSDFLREFGVNI